MSKRAFVFPGQGAQYVGMGKDFYDEFKEAKLIFEEASEVLNIDMASLCFEENEKINVTEFTQPAILTTSVAILKVIEKMGYKPDVVAGLSLGEYSALVANGILTFEDAVKIVQKRGRFMQQAVPVGEGTMAAVIGLSASEVEATCQELSEIVELANYNCPGQIVISGEVKGVKKAAEKLKEKGARRVIMLNVSGPFHSSMLKPAGDRLKNVLDTITFNQFDTPYIANTTAHYVKEIEEIKPLLIEQVASSVKWEQTIQQMIQDEVEIFVEIGPSKTLTNFIRKIDRTKKVINIEKPSDLEQFGVLIEGGVLC